jgi:hypothetical protein
VLSRSLVETLVSFAFLVRRKERSRRACFGVAFTVSATGGMGCEAESFGFSSLSWLFCVETRVCMMVAFSLLASIAAFNSMFSISRSWIASCRTWISSSEVGEKVALMELSSSSGAC